LKQQGCEFLRPGGGISHRIKGKLCQEQKVMGDEEKKNKKAPPA
jgi:hypothetical protein